MQWLQHMLMRERRSRLATAEELHRERAKSAALEQEILAAARAAQDMGESLCCLFFNPFYADQETLLQEPSSQLLQEHAQTAAWQHGLQQHTRGDQVLRAHQEALQRLAQQQQQPTQQPNQLADGVLSPDRADTGPAVTHDQAPQHAVLAAPLLSSSSSWTQGLGGIGLHMQHPPARSSPRRSPRRLARSSCSSPPKTAAGALSSLAPAGISAAKDDVAQAGAAEQAPSDQGQPQQGLAAASGRPEQQQQHTVLTAAASQAASPVEKVAAPASSGQSGCQQQQQQMASAVAAHGALRPAPSTEAKASGSPPCSSSAASQQSVYAAGGRQRSHSSSTGVQAARAGSGGEGSSTGESPAVLAPFGSVLSAEPVNHGQGARCCSSSSSSDEANSWALARRPGLRLLPETIAPAAVSGAAAAEAAGSAAERLLLDAGSRRAWHAPAAGRPDEPPAAGRAAMQAPRVQGSTCVSGLPGADSRRQPGLATGRFDSATRIGTASPAAAAQEGPLAKARPNRYAAAPTARQQHNSTAQCVADWPGLSSSAGAITHCRREEQQQELLLMPLTRVHSQPGRVRVGSSSHRSVAPPTASSVAAAQLPHRHDAALVQRLADGRGAGHSLVQQGCLSPLRWHRGNLGSSRVSFRSMVRGAGSTWQLQHVTPIVWLRPRLEETTAHAAILLTAAGAGCRCRPRSKRCPAAAAGSL